MTGTIDDIILQLVMNVNYFNISILKYKYIRMKYLYIYNGIKRNLNFYYLYFFTWLGVSLKKCKDDSFPYEFLFQKEKVKWIKNALEDPFRAFLQYK